MPIEGNVRRGNGCPRAADALIAALAADQHGLVTRAQLTALGVGPDAIDRRIAAQRLQTRHRGVYAVAHRVRTRERAGRRRSRRLVGIVDAHGLPRPLIDRLTRDGELDATWPDHRLIVHCDGFATHGTRRAFEDDRATHRRLVAAGWRVIRLTWRQLDEDPDAIGRHLAVLLND